MKKSIEIVDYDLFRYKGKDSLLYVCLLVPDRTYPDMVLYDHKTVFSQMEKFETFKAHVDTLTRQEVIDFRDFFDGNILSDLAKFGKNIEWFEYVHEIVGETEFRKMLYAKSRCGYCPLGAINNIDAFKVLISNYNITSDILYQLARNCRTEELEYVADMVNLLA